jgi:hypothetical protein
MNIPLKWPAYGMSVFKRRAAGWTPWLVVAAIGAPVDWETFRGDYGVARIGFGPRFPFFRGDYRMVVGLDVLCSFIGLPGVDEAGRRERDQMALTYLWRNGRVATLWTLESGFVYRVNVREYKDELSFVVDDQPNAIDESFQAVVATAREFRLAVREGVFADEAFDEAHELLMARIARGTAPALRDGPR